MSLISPLKLTLMLAPMVSALALAMDVYVPAIPNMTEYFHVSDNVMLLTLNVFMLTAGLMQLLIGPLSDAYGRKKLLYFVTSIFSLGCFLCAISPSPSFLIAFRIIQSVGCCGLLVLGFTIVRDCYSGTQCAKIYSSLNGLISFSPMFAPFVGSYIDIYFGWRATFLSLLIIAFINFITLYFFLPETLPVARRQSFTLKETYRNYLDIFHSKTFLIYTAVTCFGLSYLYLFCALSPYLIIRSLQIPEHQYGFYFFYMGLSFFLGSTFCGLIVDRLGIYKTCLLGLCITLIGGVWMAGWYFSDGLSLHGFIYPMLLIGIGGTFCMSAGNAGAMTPFGEHTGTAAALAGTMRFLFASLTGFIVINDHVASTLPLGLPAIFFSLAGLVLFRKVKEVGAD